MAIMAKLQIDAVLRDLFGLLKRDLPLTLSVGAIFYFLPSFIFYGLVPQNVAPAGDPNWAQFQDLLIDAFLIPSLLIGTFGSVGTVMIIRLWYQEQGATVGDALRYGIAMVPVTVAMHIAINIGVIGGMLLFIIPGIYVSVRMMMAMALLADKPMASPVEAWRDCWTLSQGHGVPIFLLMLIVGLVTMLAAFALGLIDVGMNGAATQQSLLLVGFTNGLITLLGGMLNAALAAAAYRQLRMPDISGIFS